MALEDTESSPSIILSCLMDFLSYKDRAYFALKQIKSDEDWAVLTHTALSQRLGGFLFNHLKSYPDMLHQIPSKYSAALWRNHRKWIMYQRKQLGVLAEALNALSNKGISSITLKGPHLAQTVYKAYPAIRSFGDLDIVVKKQDLIPAMDVLVSLGYECETLGEDSDFWLFITKHITALRKNELGFEDTIELHWDVFEPRICSFGSEFWWDNTTSFGQEWGDCALVLQPEALVFHLCLDAAIGLLQEGIRNVYDVASVIKMNSGSFDWEKLLRLSEKSWACQWIRVVLLCAKSYFDSPVPNEIVRSIAEQGLPENLPDAVVQVLCGQIDLSTPKKMVSIIPKHPSGSQYRISGRVQFADGSWLPHARVYYEYHWLTRGEVQADCEGRFAICSDMPVIRLWADIPQMTNPIYLPNQSQFPPVPEEINIVAFPLQQIQLQGYSHHLDLDFSVTVTPYQGLFWSKGFSWSLSFYGIFPPPSRTYGAGDVRNGIIEIEDLPIGRYCIEDASGNRLLDVGFRRESDGTIKL